MDKVVFFLLAVIVLTASSLLTVLYYYHRLEPYIVVCYVDKVIVEGSITMFYAGNNVLEFKLRGVDLVVSPGSQIHIDFGRRVLSSADKVKLFIDCSSRKVVIQNMSFNMLGMGGVEVLKGVPHSLNIELNNTIVDLRDLTIIIPRDSKARISIYMPNETLIEFRPGSEIKLADISCEGIGLMQLDLEGRVLVASANTISVNGKVYSISNAKQLVLNMAVMASLLLVGELLILLAYIVIRGQQAALS